MTRVLIVAPADAQAATEAFGQTFTVIAWDRSREAPPQVNGAALTYLGTGAYLAACGRRAASTWWVDTGTRTVSEMRAELGEGLSNWCKLNAKAAPLTPPPEMAESAPVVTEQPRPITSPEPPSVVVEEATVKQRRKAKAKLNGHAIEPPAEVDAVPAKTRPTGPTSWTGLGLVVNSNGIPFPNLDNAAAILERHPALAGRVWFDEFLQRILTTWCCDEPREWRDDDDVRLTLLVQRSLAIGKMSVEAMRQGVVAVAYGRTRNECREWLEALEHDGTARVRQMMPKGFGAEPSAYAEAVAVYWMCGMCKRVLEPGSKVDAMPVFEGEQGASKSTALSIIGGKWFAEAHEDIKNKDFYGVLQGKLLVEICEMHAFNGAEIEQVKGKISCRVDRYRAPYGRYTKDYPRQGVFAGTTNRDDWNRDETGARRFLPIKCGNIDLKWLAANRDQLFAEALTILKSGHEWWRIESEDSKREQEARRQHDTWEEPISDYLKGRTHLRLRNLLDVALKIEDAKQDKGVQLRAGRCLRALGWYSKSVRQGEITGKLWMPNGTEKPPAGALQQDQQQDDIPF